MKKLVILSIAFTLFLQSNVLAKTYKNKLTLEKDEEDSVVVNNKTNSNEKNEVKNTKTTKEKNNTNNTKDSNSFVFPYLSGNLLFRYNADFLTGHHRKDFLGKNNSMSYADVEANLNVNFTETFSIASKLVFEPTQKRTYKGSVYTNDFYAQEKYLKRKHYLKEYGLKVEELYAQYKNDDFNAGVGKFNPSFALGYDKTRYIGTNGSRFTEEYELTEKVGAFASMNLPFFRFRANFFFDDTSFLSDSVIRNRKKLKKDIVAGDTNKMNNFSLTTEFLLPEDFKINLGMRRLAVEKRYLDPEYGYTFGIEKIFDDISGFEIIPFFETVYLNNFRGEKERDVYYATLNIPFIYKNWNFTITESAKLDRNNKKTRYNTVKYGNKTSHFTQFNIGYKFENGIMFDVSKTFGKEYKKFDDSNKKLKSDLNSWNFVLSYVLNVD